MFKMQKDLKIYYVEHLIKLKCIYYCVVCTVI